MTSASSIAQRLKDLVSVTPTDEAAVVHGLREALELIEALRVDIDQVLTETREQDRLLEQSASRIRGLLASREVPCG